MSPLLLFILLIPLHLQVKSADISSEETILLSLKQHWSNPPSLKSWNSSASSACGWAEIECAFGKVTGLHLAEKHISGTIPSTICQLKNLTLIDLSKNNISGHIPVSLTNCTNLEELYLSSNVLSGSIPGEFFLMKRLKTLSLYGNRLSGQIPTPMEANSLDFLDLSDNNLNGSIPDDIRNLYNLLRLDLSMNSLSGTIPKGLFHKHQLYYLSVAHNNLSGQLPAQFDLFSLVELNLAHNHINGTIPTSLGELLSLSILDLSHNQLSGDIIENLFHLRSKNLLVSLCSNTFLGKIPYEFVNRDFGEHCLDHSNLCSDNRTEGLPSCPSKLCSDYRVQRFLTCESKHDDSSESKHDDSIESKHDDSKSPSVIIIPVAVGCGVVGFAVLYYLARKYWVEKSRRYGQSLKETEKWEMISFQKAKFNKDEILSSLTDENQIGSGGSGKVYRVFINQTRSAVAVKIVSSATKSEHSLEKEFLAEIRTLGSIRHNNIVKLLCYISGKNMKLLVYQYFENKSLDQWLHGNKRQTSSADSISSVPKLDWPMRLHIAIGIAQGLCYMHHDCSPPIVHRDIKSRNILLDTEFNAKVADFGLAKLLNRLGDTETASAVAGTFGYIAPEYAYTKKVNTKIDVYSFGVVLLELTTGRKAVTEGDHMNLAEWAQLLYRYTIAVVDALDADIKEAVHMDQMIAVFRLGVICTAKSPSHRPSMKDCLHILWKCSNNVSHLSSELNI